MYTFKDKVTEKLSRLFADSPNASSSASPSPQARSYSKETKSFSSYFSHIITSAGFNGSRSNKHQHDFKPCQSDTVKYSNANFEAQDEYLDDYAKCSPVCVKKVTLSNQEDYEDPASGRSTSGSDMFEDATDQHSPQKPLPYLMDESVFISPDLHEFLLSSLPNIVKGCQWALLYRAVR